MADEPRRLESRAFEAAKRAEAGPAPRALRLLRRLLVSEYFILYLTFAYFLAMAVFFPDLVTPRNISNQLSNVWPLLCVAIGQTFVIIIMGIDLSQGAIMGFVSVARRGGDDDGRRPEPSGRQPALGFAHRRERRGSRRESYSVAVAVVVMLAAGSLIGLVNGYFIARFKMPAFMVTLVSLMLFSSAGIWLTQSQNIVNLPAEFSRLGSGDLVSFYFGEKAEADDQAPRRPALRHLSGADRAWARARRGDDPAPHRVRPLRLCGRHQSEGGGDFRRAGQARHHARLCSRAFAPRSPRSSIRPGCGGRPTIGSGGVLLDIIGATVIGGTSFAGGKGRISWTFIGVVFFVLLGNTLNYMGLSAFYIDVVKGGIILAAAALDVARTRLLAGRRGMSEPILELEGISKAFAGIHAVRDVSSRSGAGACSA